MNIPPTGSIVVITGCGRRRVGYHIAKYLIEKGFSVASVYRSQKEQAEQIAEELRTSIPSENDEQQFVKTYHCDISKEESVQSLASEISQNQQPIAAVVNTASVWKQIPLEEITESDLLQHISVDLVGTFHMNRVFGLQLVGQSSGGCIINFGDWAESRPYPDHAAYFAAKGSIPTLTRCMARELGTRNPKVRVHCILPGPVLLPVESDQNRREKLIQSTLVKQVDRPDSIAMSVEHFIQNDFINGVCLPVDGGRTIYCPQEDE